MYESRISEAMAVSDEFRLRVPELFILPWAVSACPALIVSDAPDSIVKLLHSASGVFKTDQVDMQVPKG